MNTASWLNAGHWVGTYNDYAQLIFEVDADLYQNEALTRDEIDQVDRAVGLHNLSGSFMDLACGIGRHARELVRRGVRPITAIDGSEGFIRLAGQLTPTSMMPQSINYLVGDLRLLTSVTKQTNFGCATMLGNSFGYFDDQTNYSILCNINFHLRRGGLLIFDISNIDYVINNLRPYDEFEVETPSFGSLLDIRYRRWNAETRRMVCRKIHQTRPADGSAPHVLLDTPYQIRQYTRGEILFLLCAAGFEAEIHDENRFFEEDGVRAGLTSKRLLVVARKTRHLTHQDLTMPIE